MSSTVAEIVAAHPHVLLDFDGPVCAVFGITSAATVADHLRNLLGGDVPGVAGTSNDPFDVLIYAATRGPDVLAEVEDEFRRHEVSAVASAPMTRGIRDALSHLTTAGHTITIVSNNSSDAVTAYLSAQYLAAYVDGVSARTEPNPALLKPNSHLLDQAVRRLDTLPEHCVLVGDSIADIEAARAAGAAVIAYANKPGKRDRFASYAPDAVIERLAELGTA